MNNINQTEWFIKTITGWFREQSKPVLKIPTNIKKKGVYGFKDLVEKYEYSIYRISTDLDLFGLDNFKSEVIEKLLSANNREAMADIFKPMFDFAKENIDLWNESLSQIERVEPGQLYKGLEVDSEIVYLSISKDRNISTINKKYAQTKNDLNFRPLLNSELAQYSAAVYHFLNDTIFKQKHIDVSKYNFCDKYPNCDCYNKLIKPVEDKLTEQERVLFLQLIKQIEEEIRGLEWVYFDDLCKILEPDLGLVPVSIRDYFQDYILGVIEKDFGFKMPKKTDIHKLRLWLNEKLTDPNEVNSSADSKEKLTHRQQILLLSELGFFDLDFIKDLPATKTGYLLSLLLNRDEQNSRIYFSNRFDPKTVRTKRNIEAVHNILNKLEFKK